MSLGEERASPALPLAVCESIVEEAPVGVYVSQDGLLVYANRWLCDVGGCGAYADRPVEELSLVHPDDRALVLRQLRLHLAGEDAHPASAVGLLTADGGVREVQLHAKVIALRGRPAIHATLVDVSARVDAERNLQEYAARLEESNRFRQLFADILSHDLMNPVWVAENYLRLIMDDGVPDAKRPLYEGMRGSLAKARGILADARTYLRIQDRVAFAGERVDLGPLVEEVAQTLRPLSGEKRQQLVVTSAGGAVILANPLIKEVVKHLLSNAIKFGPPDAPIGVSVSAGPRVRVAVSDSGPGVPEEDRVSIFHRFERMEKGSISGIGLGLAIVRRVVDLHGGKVWIETNPRGGSVFIGEFPAAD